MKNKHILLVVDENENSFSLSLILESFGYDVSTIEESSQFIEKLHHLQNPIEQVDLVITSVNLPEQVILGLFKELKRLDIILPFIIISDNNKVHLLKQLHEAGFYGWISQPFNVVILIERVKSIFHNIETYQNNDQSKITGR